MRGKILKTVGIIGLLASTILYIKQPSFPTPDKILVFLIFAGLAFSQAVEVIKRFLPFVLILFVYESFRGIADELNKNVDFTLLPAADKLLFFGELPTVWLQRYLWNGQVQWYDFALYLPYMLHFVIPIGLALFVWKTREKQYWRVINTYVVLSFAGFLTYIAFPAAPPWMASDLGLIDPITRVSSHVWFALGVQDFPSLYAQVSPNAVAAMPSLHAAYATLFAIFCIKLFNARWRYISLIYPAMIFFGTVYQGEHYAIDAIVGALYALGAYWATPKIMETARVIWAKQTSRPKNVK